jgi:hypothetical protein
MRSPRWHQPLRRRHPYRPPSNGLFVVPSARPPCTLGAVNGCASASAAIRFSRIPTRTARGPCSPAHAATPGPCCSPASRQPAARRYGIRPMPGRAGPGRTQASARKSPQRFLRWNWQAHSGMRADTTRQGTPHKRCAPELRLRTGHARRSPSRQHPTATSGTVKDQAACGQERFRLIGGARCLS